MNYDIKDIKLADKGKLRIEWAARNMPVLDLIEERFKKEKPLKGINMAACLHVTTETANLMRVLKAGGADVAICASNPLSTQDDVAASLVKHLSVPTFCIKGEDTKTYYKHIKAVLDRKPHITMDDGADLVGTLHSDRKEQARKMIGGTEETTTGVIRLRSLADQGKLIFPVIAVNDAQTKHLFDNRYGTGQSTIDGIIRATNILMAGSVVVVSGYGMCGKGVAMRAKGMGAQVVITEVDPLRALEAVLDGFQVMPIIKAAPIGDVFVTVTGDTSVLDVQTFQKMKDGAIICNAGHFDVEINLKALKSLTKSEREIRPYVIEHTLKQGGKKLFVLGEGRLINLAAAEGHPSMVMDMSFANQALSAEYMVKQGKKLQREVYPVPEKIDKQIAKLKLKSRGIKIDTLTKEQKDYLASWEIGT
ncbi:MAG: adenosylhomocysteinase [bacterium]